MENQTMNADELLEKIAQSMQSKVVTIAPGTTIKELAENNISFGKIVEPTYLYVEEQKRINQKSKI